jgi:chitin disaccharide deacetylase
MDPLHVIVNADDLGMSAEVNAATFALIADGRLRSATIIANGPAFEAIVQPTRSFSTCSFGVHLNLTQFEPLTRGPARGLITNDAGVMSRGIEHASVNRRRLRAAYEEWCAQIERVASAGIPISHIDSHNHVHTRPALFPVLKAVQRRYGIRTVRLSKNLYAPDQSCSRALLVKKRVYNAALRALYPTRTTDAFTEFVTFTRLAASAIAGCRSVELMVHPGAAYAGPETELLRSDWLSGHGRPLHLINYHELSALPGSD